MTTEPAAVLRLTGRDRAILHAVGRGPAELVVGVEPDLYLDGRWCADQFAAHRLARAGFIAHPTPAPVGQRVPAQLTPAALAWLATDHDDRDSAASFRRFRRQSE